MRRSQGYLAVETNNVITGAATPTGFGDGRRENLNEGRTLQYTLKLTF